MDEWTLELLKDLDCLFLKGIIGRPLGSEKIEIEIETARKLGNQIRKAIGREHERRIKRNLASRYAAGDRRREAMRRAIKIFDAE
jgi:hypothetical protein